MQNISDSNISVPTTFAAINLRQLHKHFLTESEFLAFAIGVGLHCAEPINLVHFWIPSSYQVVQFFATYANNSYCNYWKI